MDTKQPTGEDTPLTTEVTSIAQEEERTGIKIETPSSDDLAARASSSFIINRRTFNQHFSELSSRGKVRVMNAVLDLPADGIPVYLRGELEKVAFAVGQRVISDRFVITQHHIVQEVKRQRTELAAKSLEDYAETDDAVELPPIDSKEGEEVAKTDT